MANRFSFTRANQNTPNEGGWCQRWAEQGFGLNGLYSSAFAAWKAVPKKRGGLPKHDGNYYLVYFDGWFYGARYGDVAVYRNGKVWSGSAVKWRSGGSFAAYRQWIGTPYLGWSEFCGARRIATIPVAKPKPKPAPKRIAKKGRATVIANTLNVRNKPEAKGTPVAKYKRGEKFNYDSYIDTNGYRWLSYISRSKVRRYVAARTLNNKEKYIK